MAFCGECGFLLPAQATTCPRCGATVIPHWAAEGQEPDNPTALSLKSFLQQEVKTSLFEQPSPPNLAQTADSSDYNSSAEWDPATSLPSVETPSPAYSTLGAAFTENIPPQEMYGPTSVLPSASSDASLAVPVRKTNKRGIVLAVVFVSLLMLTIATFLVLQPTTVLKLLGGKQTSPMQRTVTTPSPTATTPSPTPTLTPDLQARAVVEQYYADINQKDYMSAYNLWVNYPQDPTTFQQGFAHTMHDNIIISAVAQQNDATVRVDVTFVATSDDGSEQTFQGYYIVEQQADGTWKLTTDSHIQEI